MNWFFENRNIDLKGYLNICANYKLSMTEKCTHLSFNKNLL